MVEVMTDKQFKTILEMVDMILDGCKDLAEAKEKVQKLIENQGGSKKED
jgi:tetrahydromethanopterin S-methyltransferase subunit A